jgi:hypothetical protein
MNWLGAKFVKVPRRTTVMRKAASTILLAFALGLFSVPAFAQGCAMCYSTARATPRDGQLAINRGILIMLFPPLTAMTIGVGAAFRYGKNRDSERDNETDQKL